MTWVVAASTIFGYGALYSDVQVTFRDGTVRDLLQKTFPVANFMAGGFAGSVKTGFMLMQSLRDHLEIPNEYVNTHLVDPVAAARSWSPVAKSIFATAEGGEKRLGSQILLVGISPLQCQSLGSKVYFIRFCAPSFEPQFMSRVVKICSIGSGASVHEYKHSIKPLFRLSSGLLRAEIENPGGWGISLGYAISHTINQYPHDGVSRHLNTTLITRNGFIDGKTDITTHLKNGSIVKQKMPVLAQTYDQFMEMTKASGLEGAESSC